MSGKTITVPLQEPVQYGSESITELVLQQPRGKHLRRFPDQPEIGDFLDLAGKLAGQPPSVMDELTVVDVMSVADAVAGFFPDGQPNGASGSAS